MSVGTSDPATEKLAEESKADSTPLAVQLSAVSETPKPKANDDAPADAGGEETGEEDSTPEPKRELLATVQERFGVDLSDKYTDDTALLAGLVHAQDLASRRDTEAEFGRKMRDMLAGRENDLRAYLAGEQSQTTTPATPDAPFDVAKARTQITQNEDGKLEALPGAPPGIVSRYEQHLQEIRESMEKFHADPKAFFKETMGDEITRQVQEQTGQNTAVQREELAIDKWIDAHADMLNDSKDPTVPTLLGRKVGELYESPRFQQIEPGKVRSLARAEMALEMAQLQQPRAKTSTPSQHAQRRPDTTPALPDDKFAPKEGESLAKQLQRADELEASAVG